MTVSGHTSRLWREYLTTWFGSTAVSGVDSFWLFSSRPGASKPFGPETLARRFGVLARRTSATGPVGLHRVRHTTATVLVATGEIDGAQHRLRHSRLDTTLRHYVDTTGVTDDVDVADQLQCLYGAERSLPARSLFSEAGSSRAPRTPAPLPVAERWPASPA